MRTKSEAAANPLAGDRWDLDYGFFKVVSFDGNGIRIEYSNSGRRAWLWLHEFQKK